MESHPKPPAEPAGVKMIRWAATLLAPASAGPVAAGALDPWPGRWGYSIGGLPVSREAWLATAAPIFLLAAGWMAALAVGLWRRRRWARFMAPGLFLSVAAAAALAGLAGKLPPSLISRALLETAVMTVLSVWYFFRKPTVVRYFASRSGPRTAE
jgi:hypothetical protein